MKKAPRWYGLEVLPVYLRLSRKHLKESRQQLDNFEASKAKAHLFTSTTVDHLLKGFFEQNQSVWLFEEQCKRWSQASPNEDQVKELRDLQKNVEALKINNAQLLSLARECKNQDLSV